MEVKINKKSVKSYGIKFFVKNGKKEVARAFLYIMKNDLKGDVFGYLEDLFVDEDMRGQGIATELLKAVIAKAKEIGCYKLVATSRYEREAVHKFYEKYGFKNFGIEFKMYLNGNKS